MLFLAIVAAMASVALAFVVLPLSNDRKFLRGTTLRAALMMLLPAAGMYSLLGAPSATVAISAQATPADGSAATLTLGKVDRKVGSVTSLVDGLAARLQQEPGDAAGWLLLARSYRHLGRVGEAAEAYARAAALGKTDFALEAALVSSGRLTEAATEIRGRVTLAPGVEEGLQPADTVFVFAKAMDGSSMPIAAVRRPASKLPFDFVLNDRSSLVESRKLSDFDEVTVSAKVSRSGKAMQDDTDLIAQSQSISVRDIGFVQLEIDSHE